MSLTQLFCDVDAFCQTFIPQWEKTQLESGEKTRRRKRSIIETINDQLKNIFQLEHSRHRSLTNYMINIVACLVAYSYQKKTDSQPQKRKIYSLYYKGLSRTQVI